MQFHSLMKAKYIAYLKLGYFSSNLIGCRVNISVIFKTFTARSLVDSRQSLESLKWNFGKDKK